jgi:hypothetical protein
MGERREARGKRVTRWAARRLLLGASGAAWFVPESSCSPLGASLASGLLPLA